MPANSPQVENNKSIINTLLCHRQGSEDEGFAKRAIESLVKKLRDKPSELENLLTAVTTNGTMKSNCVTIQRTLDGRLQVAGRKGFPHVIYTRIWRWPNLIKNELKHSEMCRHAFDLKHELVCINPYHYERVISSGIDLVGLNLYPTANYNSLIAKSRPAKNTDDQKVSNSNAKIKKIEKSNHDKTPKVNCGNFNSNNQNFQPNTFRTEQSQTLPNDSNVWTSNIYNNNNKIPYTIQNQNVINQPPHWNVPIMDNNSQYLNHKAPIDSSNGVKARLSNLSQPENWCTIAYFEKDQQVGETFKALAEFPAIIIDGYTDPSSLDRFCLGQLSNVHRTTDSEKARIHIGPGVKLEKRNEGDVWLKVMCEHSVFVQSYFLDFDAGRQPGDAVHKIYPSAYIKVFDLQYCLSQMNSITAHSHASALVHAAAVAGLNSSENCLQDMTAMSGAGVDDLRKLCILRFSFVKGWGSDYPRVDIKETPCWIEVHLHRALQLLDEVLQRMPTTEPDFNSRNDLYSS